MWTASFAWCVAVFLLIVVSAVGHNERQTGQTRLRISVLRERTAAGGLRFSIHQSAPAQQTVASGSFQNELHLSGWGVLDVKSNSAFPDDEQAYAAGMAEGYLTAGQIFEAQQNLYPSVFGKDVLGPDQVKPEVKTFMARQEAWTRLMVEEKGKSDPFWAHVGYLTSQFDGLIAGYAEAAHRGTVPTIDRFAFTMLNGVGDLFDVVPAVLRSERVDWVSAPLEAAELMHAQKGHCSGLIKLNGDFSDLFVGHSSWFSYSNTNRIYKHYHLNFTNPATAARKITFSSYPGFLESLDDFYLLDSGLGMIQTTNTVLDHSTYDEVKPESLLAWQRVRVSSALARSGPEFYQHMKRHFSGTYANQYMVVDYKLFEPKKAIKPNTLWVVEEMPGLMVGADQSVMLSRGYWPSYNVPFYPEVFNKSGYPQMVAQHGNFFTYELHPRAQIFRRDQAQVTDLTSLKALMRYNDYLRDPYSMDSTGEQNPYYAICARGDLHRSNATAKGCYDTKVTSFTYGAMSQKAQAVNGPGGLSLPPFSWSDPKFQTDKHVGLPVTYVFDFVHMEPAEHNEVDVPSGFGEVQSQFEESFNIVYM